MPKPKKVVKRVRIQSPVTSPDELQGDPFDAKANHVAHPGSPPPVKESDIAIELRKSFIDSVARGASNLNQEAARVVVPAAAATAAATAPAPAPATATAPAPPLPSLPISQPEAAGSGIITASSRSTPQQAPYNPFARTLASIEGGYNSTTPGPAADATIVGATLDGQA